MLGQLSRCTCAHSQCEATIADLVRRTTSGIFRVQEAGAVSWRPVPGMKAPQAQLALNPWDSVW